MVLVGLTGCSRLAGSRSNPLSLFRFFLLDMDGIKDFSCYWASCSCMKVTVHCDIILIVILANFQELIRALYETGWGCGWYRKKVSVQQNVGSTVVWKFKLLILWFIPLHMNLHHSHLYPQNCFSYPRYWSSKMAASPILAHLMK